MTGASTVPIAAAGAAVRGPALRRFVRRLRLRQVAAHALGTTLRWGLLLSLPWVAVAWLVPWWRAQVTTLVLVVLALLCGAAALRAWWRTRRIVRALGRRLVSGDGRVQLVQDELLTWFEFDRRAHRDAAFDVRQRAMLEWLERDLHGRLQPEVSRAMAVAMRPRLGRWRWLVPVLLLLLLAWWIAALFAPTWPGLLGGRRDQQTSGAGGEPQDQPGPRPGDQPGGDLPEPGDTQPDESGTPEAPPDRPEPGSAANPRIDESGGLESPAPVEVPPLLELDSDRRFVLPDFIGDGPTRRARMHAAELEQRAGGAPPPDRPAGTAATPDTATPPPIDFDRAAERAQRARNVPPAEREIVQRYFESLRRRAAAERTSTEPAPGEPGGGDEGDGDEGGGR